MVNKIDDSSISTTELTSRIQSLAGAAGVTGISVTIFNEGEVVYQQPFGLANADTGDSLRSDHVFYGASLSKAVFGYLVADLAREEVIDLDRPLQEYFPVPIPELPFAKAWRGFQDLTDDPRYEKITARMCLGHTTGFPNWRWLTPQGLDKDGKLRIDFEPGTNYQYSGEGIRLLQIAIEQITGEGLEALARQRIFDPLGMDMTSYVWQERFKGRYCLGHAADQTPFPKDTEDEAGAAGSMETTPEDYARFFGHVLRLAAVDDSLTQLLFNPSVRIRSKRQFGPLARETTTRNDAIELSYGLGWGLLQTPFGPGAFKEGHGEGFQHYTIMFPQSATGIMLLSNSDNAESIYKEVLELSVGDTYTPWEWEDYLPYE